jgi:O-antigen ligase
LLTVARGGYFAFVPVVAVLAIYYVRQLFTVRFALWVSAAVLIAGIGASQVMDLGAVTEQFITHVTQLFAGASYAERVDTISSAFAAWRTHPLVGIGPGGFGPWYAAYPLTTPASGWNIVNNEYIELLAEHGILGLGAFLLLCTGLVIRSIKALRAPGSRDVKVVLVAFLAAFIGILVQYNTFSILYIMHIWCVMGLLVALQNMILFPYRAPRL